MKLVFMRKAHYCIKSMDPSRSKVIALAGPFGGATFHQIVAFQRRRLTRNLDASIVMQILEQLLFRII